MAPRITFMEDWNIADEARGQFHKALLLTHIPTSTGNKMHSLVRKSSLPSKAQGLHETGPSAAKIEQAYLAQNNVFDYDHITAFHTSQCESQYIVFIL